MCLIKYVNECVTDKESLEEKDLCEACLNACDFLIWCYCLEMRFVE